MSDLTGLAISYTTFLRPSKTILRSSGYARCGAVSHGALRFWVQGTVAVWDTLSSTAVASKYRKQARQLHRQTLPAAEAPPDDE